MATVRDVTAHSVLSLPDTRRARTEATPHDLSYCLDRVRDNLQALQTLPRVASGVNLATVEDAVTKILQQVHSLQNGSTYAGRLPNEILSTIFAMVQDNLLERTTGLIDILEDSSVYSRWTRVMRVCQHWRHVAFATPLLWRTIFVPPRDLWPSSVTKDYFRRSGGCLLRVHVASNAHPESLLKVYAQLHRIQELTFEIHFTSLTLPMWWCVPGPTLETLVVTSFLDTPFPRLQPIFLGNFRFLKSLALRECSSYAPLVCPTLMHLHIDGCWLKGLQDLKSLFSLLRSAPALEDLKFTDMYVGNFEGALRDSRFPHVTLSSLQRLVFDHDGSNIATILSCLRLPTGVSLTFAWHRPFEHDEETAVFPEVSNDLNNLNDLRDLEFQFTAENVVTVRAVGHSSAVFSRWRMGIPDHPTAFANNLPITFRHPRKIYIYMHNLEDGDQRRVRQQAIREILGLTLPQFLILDGDRESMVDDFVEIFKHLGPEEGVMGPDHLLCASLEEVHLPVDGREKYVECEDILRMRRGAGCRSPALYLHGQYFGVKDYFSIVHLRDSGVEARTSEETVPRMEWVPICTSPSRGPWEFPVWAESAVVTSSEQL